MSIDHDDLSLFRVSPLLICTCLNIVRLLFEPDAFCKPYGSIRIVRAVLGPSEKRMNMEENMKCYQSQKS